MNFYYSVATKSAVVYTLKSGDTCYSSDVVHYVKINDTAFTASVFTETKPQNPYPDSLSLGL